MHVIICQNEYNIFLSHNEYHIIINKSSFFIRARVNEFESTTGVFNVNIKYPPRKIFESNPVTKSNSFPDSLIYFELKHV